MLPVIYSMSVSLDGAVGALRLPARRFGTIAIRRGQSGVAFAASAQARGCVVSIVAGLF
jgi:hypothetical protein